MPAASGVTRPAKSAPVLAFLWGLAEATAFFIVPDAWVSRIALRDLRRAWLTALWALGGALLGGAALWWLAHRNHDSVQFLLNASDWLPGISRETMVRSAQALHTYGLPALAVGGLMGQPFKLFAIHAGAQEVALLPFLAASAIGIALRLLTTSVLSALLARVLHRQAPDFVARLHLWIWMGVYLVYFALNR